MLVCFARMNSYLLNNKVWVCYRFCLLAFFWHTFDLLLRHHKYFCFKWGWNLSSKYTFYYVTWCISEKNKVFGILNSGEEIYHEISLLSSHCRDAILEKDITRRVEKRVSEYTMFHHVLHCNCIHILTSLRRSSFVFSMSNFRGDRSIYCVYIAPYLFASIFNDKI